MFGMNVGGIPFAGSESGFWSVVIFVVFIVGLGVAIAWSCQRRPLKPLVTISQRPSLKTTDQVPSAVNPRRCIVNNQIGPIIAFVMK
jgi:hypothetical protein